MRQGRQRPHADERRSSQMPLIWTGHTLEHPGRNLQPAIRLQSAQRAAENISVRLADSLMDGHAQRRPGMPRVQKLTENGPVGVLKPCSTTNAGRTRRLPVEHRIKPISTTSRCGRRHEFRRRSGRRCGRALPSLRNTPTGGLPHQPAEAPLIETEMVSRPSQPPLLSRIA
jgi:hypothetical protein